MPVKADRGWGIKPPHSVVTVVFGFSVAGVSMVQIDSGTVVAYLAYRLQTIIDHQLWKV